MSEHTIDTLKELIEVQLRDQERAVQAALAAAKEAVNKAELAAEKRFESVNEFRAQTKDLQSSYMPRAEFDIAMKNVEEKIRGKNFMVAVTSVGLVVALLIAVFNFASANAGV